MEKKLKIYKLRRNIYVKLKHQISCKYLKGSYSVEAALIVPIIFGMLFAMLYVLFFFHDKAVLYGNMNRELTLVSEGSCGYKSDKEWQEKIQENLWIMHVSNGQVLDKKIYVSGDAVAQSEWEIPIMQSFLNKKQRIKIEIKRKNVLPGELLWGKNLVNSDNKVVK